MEVVIVFVAAFVGAFVGGFVGVFATKAIGAWTVRRAFQKMKDLINPPRKIDDCCVVAPPATWLSQPVGYAWACGVCGQRWEKTGPAMAERTADSVQKRP